MFTNNSHENYKYIFITELQSHKSQSSNGEFLQLFCETRDELHNVEYSEGGDIEQNLCSNINVDSRVPLYLTVPMPMRRIVSPILTTSDRQSGYHVPAVIRYGTSCL